MNEDRNTIMINRELVKNALGTLCGDAISLLEFDWEDAVIKEVKLSGKEIVFVFENKRVV